MINGLPLTILMVSTYQSLIHCSSRLSPRWEPDPFGLIISIYTLATIQTNEIFRQYPPIAGLVCSTDNSAAQAILYATIANARPNEPTQLSASISKNHRPGMWHRPCIDGFPQRIERPSKRGGPRWAYRAPSVQPWKLRTSPRDPPERPGLQRRHAKHSKSSVFTDCYPGYTLRDQGQHHHSDGLLFV